MKISLAAEPIFHIGSFAVTNTLLMSWVIIAFLFAITFLLRKKLFAVPRGLQNIVELGVEKLLNFMESVTGDRSQAKKFFPLIATIFIFVILSNWL